MIRRSIFPRIFAASLSLCLIALAASGASTAPERFQIQDHGQPRAFELALDELDVADAAHQHTPQVITVQSTLAALRQQAEALGQSTGNDVELVLYESGVKRTEYSRRVLTKDVLVELEAGRDAQALAAAAGASGWSAAPLAAGYFIFSATETGGALALADSLRAEAGVLSADPLLARRQQKKLIPNDTLFTSQWHLRNTGQGGGTAGTDINVTNVWNKYQGAGIRLAIVDDGLQYTHPDLAPNYDPTVSTNITGGNADPAPNVAVDDHGTACAGVAAARGTNGLGVTGAAFQATLVGIRLIGNLTVATDAQEAAAMNHRNDVIHIKSNSWGPPDDGQSFDAPGALTAAALQNGATTGRGGKGIIYVWAAGNGLAANDNANYDGYANSIYTIATTAVSDKGLQTDYAEPGACIIVAAPSDSSGRQGITTTDLVGEDGYNFSGATGELADKNYTQTFGGTSSAAPLAAGVAALMLNANTNLGWRDVQEILIRTARKNAPTDTDWITNGAGFKFNHKFGAGLIDAGAAVAMATNWVNLGVQSNVFSSQSPISVPIPDGNATGITRSFVISNNVFMRVEHVTVTMSATHPFRGDIVVTLISPNGTQSRLTELHDDGNANLVSWKLMSVRNWGESAAGTWQVKVADPFAVFAGTLTAIRLDLFGSPSPQPADLTVTAAGTPDPIVAGNLLTYSLSVHNNGPTNSMSAVLTNTLPPNATFVSATASQGTATPLGGKVVCNLGYLASNATATVTIKVVPGVSGTLTNIATVSGSQPDLVTNNNSFTVTTTVQPQIFNVTVQARPSSALINWSTRTNTTAQIEYGFTTNYDQLTTLNTTLTTNHASLLTGLTPGANYFFTIIAKVGTNVVREGPFTFSTDLNLIVDNPQATYSGTWTLGTSAADKYGTYYQSAPTITAFSPNASATYTPNIPLSGIYDVAIWYPAGANRSTNAQVTLFYNSGIALRSVDQTVGGGAWQTIATGLDFVPGTGGFGVIGNNTSESGKVVMADAMRWSYSLAQDNPPFGTVPSWWSDYYFGSSVNAALDPDGDGFSTYAEYVAGTEPTNAVSRLTMRVEATASGAQVIFSPLAGGRIYQLASGTNLNMASWSLLPNTPTANGAEGVFSITNSGGTGPRYYRVGVRMAE